MYGQYARTNYTSYIVVVHVFLTEEQSAPQSSQLDFEPTVYNPVPPVQSEHLLGQWKQLVLIASASVFDFLYEEQHFHWSKGQHCALPFDSLSQVDSTLDLLDLEDLSYDAEDNL